MAGYCKCVLLYVEQCLSVDVVFVQNLTCDVEINSSRRATAMLLKWLQMPCSRISILRAVPATAEFVIVQLTSSWFPQ